MGPAVTIGERADTFSFPDARAVVIVSKRAAGDLRPASASSAERRQAVLAGPWAYASQEHGASVRSAESCGLPGDAVVGRRGEPAPAMFAADCALLGVVSPEGELAAVHAGWRGLLAGVIEAAGEALRSRGASRLWAVRGPVIGPECYQFGPHDLDRLTRAYGPSLRGETAAGKPALDLGAGVAAACERAGIELVATVTHCTACARDEAGEPLYYSHRARHEAGRHALVVSAEP